MDGMEIVVDELEKTIRAKISGDSPFSPKSCIFKVPEVLRRHNPKVYQPDVVSIGPFHDRRRPQFQPVEKVKHWYLHNFLSRTNTSLEGLIKAVMEKGNACSFYADPIDHLSPSDFVEMMILDGCFMVELFWKKKVKDPSIENDLIFKTTYMFQHICRDLLLLENQLPWFILKCIWDKGSYDKVPSLSILMLTVFSSNPPLAHNCKSYLNYLTDEKTNDANDEILHTLDLLRTSITFPLSNDQAYKDSEIRLKYPATALSRSGIKFKRGSVENDRDSIMNIQFQDGVFTSPQLITGELTEPLFRNLIAFEQCYHNRPLHITSYAVLMDNLIDSSDDMEFLCENQIIGNWLSAEDGSKFFNKPYIDTFVTEFYSLL